MQNFNLVNTQGNSDTSFPRPFLLKSPPTPSLSKWPLLLLCRDWVHYKYFYSHLNSSLPQNDKRIYHSFLKSWRTRPFLHSTSALVSKCLLNCSILMYCHVHLTFIKETTKVSSLGDRKIVPLMLKTEKRHERGWFWEMKNFIWDMIYLEEWQTNSNWRSMNCGISVINLLLLLCFILKLFT